ncbi:MAG: hypothetical protein U0935_16485 [Pirellulales bacterium]
MATAIWFLKEGVLASQPLPALRWLAGGRLLPEPCPDALPIAPVPRYDGAVAVLLLPDSLRGRVILNDVVADGGLLPLRHADHVVIDGSSVWAAGEFVAEETEYSLTRHDKEARCFITKARLREGEPITICPGQPGKPCGMIYKRGAWNTVVSEAARFRCPNCAYDPQATAWRPAPPATRPTLDHVFHLLNWEPPR